MSKGGEYDEANGAESASVPESNQSEGKHGSKGQNLDEKADTVGEKGSIGESVLPVVEEKKINKKYLIPTAVTEDGITASWSLDKDYKASTSDYVGVCKAEGDATSYESYAYSTGKMCDEVVIPWISGGVGQYVLRYFDSQYEVILESARINLGERKDDVSIEQDEEAFFGEVECVSTAENVSTVRWNVPEAKPTDYIVICKTDAEVGSHLASANNQKEAKLAGSDEKVGAARKVVESSYQNDENQMVKKVSRF